MNDNQSTIQNILLGSSPQTLTGVVPNSNGLIIQLQSNSQTYQDLSLSKFNANLDIYLYDTNPLFNSTPKLLASSTNFGLTSELIHASLGAGNSYLLIKPHDPVFSSSSFELKSDPVINYAPKAAPASNLVAPGYMTGSDGANQTNAAIVSTFNQVNGTQILGKAIDNVHSIAGGTVQDFERGSIFQSIAGTFTLQGTLNNFYKDLSAADKIRLGLPTANETSSGGYWHQAFQNGDLQLVQGAPVKWLSQFLINERFTLLSGSLGQAVGSIHNVNGAPVQDYTYGSIFVIGNKTVVATGTIGSYYRANSAALGLPTSEEVTTSYGKSQTFQGALVTSSTQFGVHTLHGSVVGYYSGLTAAQKDQLGAATTEEAVGGDGNWQQFFKGGSVLWKSNGTGDVKFTPFTIGFDGTSVNSTVTTKFNAVVGWDVLGKAIDNVHSITGGTVQDFERGSIFQSIAGTFTLQGTLNNFYKDLSAADKIRLGLPTATETSMGGYWHQAFQNGDLQLVQGAPVKWSNQTLIKDRFTLIGGATSLGNAVAAIHTVNGSPVQDYDKGSIVVIGNRTIAITGAIASYYRANSAVLLLPTSEEVTTSYGKSQTFQGALVTASTQFGVHTLHGSLVGYYTGLTAAQKDQLGAAITEEAKGGDGNWQQFFKGGSVLWKNDGTGEVKLTPFTIGFNGTNVNPTFTSKFNEIVGWDALGKVTGNVRSIAGGTVQDFEKGSIFQTATGTFAVRGQIGAYYRGDSASLGLPTTEEIGTSYGWRQDFASGKTLIHSPQFGTQVLEGSLAGYYRGLSEAQRNQLGAVYTGLKDLGGGNWRQFFTGGTVEWKNNGTGEVKLTPSFSIGLTGNTVNNSVIDKFDSVGGWNALGSPTSNVKTVTGGMVQDFQKGSMYQSAKGTFVLDGVLLEMYRQQYSSSIGLPIGDKVSTVNGLRQDFENGILINTPTAQTFALKGGIASYYKGLNDTQLKALGAPINNAGDSNGGVAQYFQNGVVYSSSFGTFSVRGVLSERAASRGVPIGEEKVVGDGLKQDFTEGSATYSVKAGIHEITGGLVKYYQSLTEAQKTQLGVAYTNTWTGGNNAFQFFQGGVIELNRNGASQIRFTQAIGFDGNTFNAKFFDKYMSLENIDGLGDPISGVVNINGTLRQDFQKGFITQTGVVVEGKRTGYSITEIESQLDAYWQKNSATLGSKFDPTSSAARATKQDDGSYIIFYKDGYLTWKDGQITNGKVTNVIDLTQPKPSPSSGNVIIITSNPQPQPSNGGGVIVITSNPQPTQPSTPTVQYTTETRTVQVPAQNALPSPVTNASSFADSSLHRDGLDIVYENLSGTVITDALSLRIDAPYTSSPREGYIYRNQSYQFNAWARGEYVVNTDIWLHVAGTHDWVSAYYIQTNAPITTVPVYGTNFKGVVNSTAGVNIRRSPTTNLASVGSYNNQTELSFDGYATGESINGNDRWYRIAGTQNWVSSYLIFGSPDRSVSLDSTRPTTKTETVQIPVYTNPTPSQPSVPSVDSNFSNAYAGAGGANGILHNPTSNSFQINGGWQQNFQGGAIISSNRGTYTLYGGIGSYYLQNEGGANGRLGVPISGEQGIGNGKTVQHFQNGDILYGNGVATSTLLTAGTAIRYLGASEEFTGTVMPSIGVAFRYTPHENDRSAIARAYNTALSIDAWTYGDTLIDTKLGTPDNKWYHVKGENYWVPSAYIDGGVGRSVLPTSPLPSNPTPVGGTSMLGDSAKGGTIRTGGIDAIQYLDYGGYPIDEGYTIGPKGHTIGEGFSHPLFVVPGQGPLVFESLKFTLLPSTVEQANDFFKTEIYDAKYNPSGPQSSTNCGPSSLAMIMKMFKLEPSGMNIETSILHARALMNGLTGERNTVQDTGSVYWDQILTGVNAVGKATDNYSGSWEKLDQSLYAGDPVILNGITCEEWSAKFPDNSKYVTSTYLHLIAILGKTPDGQYLVADPMYRGGVVPMTKEQLSVFIARQPKYDTIGSSYINGIPHFISFSPK
jgi:uncharacterized protein with LGFP repeats